jgi:hypothetical protein
MIGGQQRVVTAPPDMTINARMACCDSLESLCQVIIVASNQVRRMKAEG